MVFYTITPIVRTYPLKNAVQFCAATGAEIPLYQFIAPYMKTISLNQDFPAMGAEGVFPRVAGNIAGVNVFETCGLADFIRSLNGCIGRHRKIEHFILGMEAADMPGRFNPEGAYEIGHFSKFRLAVI